MSYKVEMASIVSRRIVSILKTVADCSANLKTVDKLSVRFERALLSLGEFPYRFPLIQKEPWRSKGVRRMPIKPYIAYYNVSEKEKLVSVGAIGHSKQNQADILEEAFGI